MVDRRIQLEGISRATDLLLPAEVLRVSTFSDAAQELLLAFCEHASLQSIRLTARCAITAGTEPGTVVASHSFSITSPCRTLNLQGAEATAWALEHLPFETLGTGVCEIQRSSVLVAAYLSTSDSANAALYASISGVAAQLATAFEHLRLVHEFDDL